MLEIVHSNKTATVWAERVVGQVVEGSVGRCGGGVGMCVGWCVV